MKGPRGKSWDTWTLRVRAGEVEPASKLRGDGRPEACAAGDEGGDLGREEPQTLDPRNKTTPGKGAIPKN